MSTKIAHILYIPVCFTTLRLTLSLVISAPDTLGSWLRRTPNGLQRKQRFEEIIWSALPIGFHSFSLILTTNLYISTQPSSNDFLSLVARTSGTGAPTTTPTATANNECWHGAVPIYWNWARIHIRSRQNPWSGKFLLRWCADILEIPTP